MREIKFRAWDPARKRMFTHPKWVEFRVDLSGRLLAFNYDRDRNEQELIVLQYTGLKDRYKKEICGKDICSFVNTEGNEIVGIVQYSQERASWLFKNIEISRLFDSGFYQPSSDPCGSNANGWPGNGLEVIGNIYENPELLSIDQSA